MTYPYRRSTGEPRLAAIASWAVLVASFGLSASTWIALARVAGFTDALTIPMVGVRFAMAWLMPIAVDGYVVVALVLWMAPVPTRVATFAKRNTYGAASVGILAQSAYHLLFTMSTTNETWRVALAAIVGALPPTVAGLAVHMRALIRRESDTSRAPQPGSASTPVVSTPPTNLTMTAVPASSAGPARSDDPSPTGDRPDPAPVPVAARAEVPTPAQVAARLTRPRTTTDPTDPAPGPAQAAPSTRRPRPAPGGTTAPTLAPSTTDIPVTESDAAQLSLPIVPADLLARATQVARQYHAEHGTPITPGQLAVRLRLSTEQATQALAVLDLDPNQLTTPVTRVNGHRPDGATR